MIDFSTTYLGLKLNGPIVVSSTPISESIENVRVGASRNELRGVLACRGKDCGVPAGVVVCELDERALQRFAEVNG